MSACFVSKTDIDLIVSSIQAWNVTVPTPLQHMSPTSLGRWLWAENLRSLNACHHLAVAYRAAHERCERLIEDYEFTQYVAIKPAQFHSVLEYYEYQCCDHEGWQASEAHQLCRNIADALLKLLIGDDTGPWGISRPADLEKVCGGAPSNSRS